MSRFPHRFVCTLALLTIFASGAGAADYAVESVNADTGAVVAKARDGTSITLTIDRSLAGNVKPGQTVSIDPASGTMTLTVPVRVQGAGGSGGAPQAQASEAKAKGTKSSGGGGLPKVDTSQVTASEGSTAGAIRGRPNTSARELPNLRGEFSPASENPNSEPDDVVDFSRYVMPAAARTDQPQATSSAVTISNYPRGGGAGDLLDRLAKGLKDKEIDVALLGGQKYMIADCLGVKASAGKFRLKLANPEAKLEGTGAVLRFAIDHIQMSALKVRVQPSANFNPCSWSGRIEIGGEMKDVRLEIRIDPILELERCRVSDPGQMKAAVRIGSINFKGINNELDKAAKNMIEDSLTFALQFMIEQTNSTATGEAMMFVNQVIQTLDDILEADCPGNPGGVAKAAKEGAQNIGLAATSDQAGTGARRAGDMKLPGDGASAKPFAVVANPALKGRLGRLIIAYPKDSKGNDATRFDIYKPGEDKPIQGGYGKAEIDLMPGKYVVSIAQKKIADVEIASRHDTRLTTGAIRVNAGKDTRVDILDADKKTKLVGDYGVLESGLPVGTYHVQIAGSVEPVTIEEGKVTEF